MTQSQERASWSGRLGFVLAAAGSAVGLGNIWKFPYITGVNGGGMFVIIYLGCIALVGLPIFLAELYIGQKAQKNPVEAFEVLDRKGSAWRYIGIMGVVSGILILSFYSVVGGWVLDFELRSLLNEFAGHSDEEIKGYLGSLFGDPARLLIWHAIFMAATVGMVIGGIREGVEKWNRILMPALVLLLAGLFVYSMFLDGFWQAVTFLFSPDASKLSQQGVLESVGHSFFTLSLGMGAIITYGSYLGRQEKIVATAVAVAAMDTLIALVAGVVIFSVVFSFGLEAGAGPTLMFQTLPVLFSKIPGGYLISVAFFLLVAFAALTSAISLLEVVVTYGVEVTRYSRKTVTVVSGFIIFLLGILSVLSFNELSGVTLGKFNIFDLFDKATSNVSLPLGGVLISLFFGWKLGPAALKNIFGKSQPAMQTALLWITRVGAPILVLLMMRGGLVEIYEGLLN